MPFFDIFSKSKTPKKQEIKIIVDTREKNSLVASYLISLGFDIEFKQLPVADYLLGDTAIERKTLSDLSSSIINKRIFSQLLEIKQYPRALLFVEGSPNKPFREGILNENALRGFLLSVALEHHIPIIFTQNEEDTAKYLSLLARKKENRSPSAIRPSKITLTPEQRMQYILEGFPQIGPVSAVNLIGRFKTLKNIVNAREESLEEILGKKAKSFMSLLDYEASFSKEESGASA